MAISHQHTCTTKTVKENSSSKTNEVPDRNHCGSTQRNEKSAWDGKYMGEFF